ncbi:hypothetical protein D3C76_1497730 [compost metagenome]
MAQTVEHHETDGHAPQQAPGGVVFGHGGAVVAAQVVEALEQLPVEPPVADQHIGFQVQGQAQWVEVA